MENKIKVGDYIRTKEWGIAKVNKIDNGKVTMIKNKNNRTTHYFTQLKEPSQNIIDLIEEGDVIVLRNNKKYEVLKISWSKSKGTHIHIVYPLRMYGGIDIFENDIKSIVTKEKFKSIEYEV